MPRLSVNERHQATRFIVAGVSQSEIARRLGVAQSTISRLHERLDTTGSTSDRPGSGRPRETTPRQDRQIRLNHLRNRFQTSVETAANIPGRHNNRISAMTVRSCLREFGIKARRPYVGLPLTRQRRIVRNNTRIRRLTLSSYWRCVSATIECLGWAKKSSEEMSEKLLETSMGTS